MADHSRRTFLAGACAATLATVAQAASAGKKPKTSGAKAARGRAATAPKREAPQVQWSRRVPVRYEADVAVIGAGMAGVSAACAAAKSGAKVLVVERFAVAGGNSTSGGVAAFCGETHGQGEVFDAIVAELEKFRAIAAYKPYPKMGARVFDHAILAVVLQELLLSRGVKLLLHTRFADVCAKSGRISEAILVGKSGPEALRAKVFIDCSGEADVARMAGFETLRGRPSDGCQLPMSLMFYVRHVPKKYARPQVPEGWLEPIESKDDLPMTSPWPNRRGGNAIKIKIPCFDASDTESLTAAEIAARRRMMQVLDYFQRVEKKPWILEDGPTIIGIREGQRIVGDHVLTVDELRKGCTFGDAVARGVFYLDAHKPDDDKRTYILPPKERSVPPYQVPFRSLVARDGKNLLAAGRVLSADQLALSSARVTTTCSMMGQAAGIAAAMCVEGKCDVRDLDYGAVRKVVEERGARLAT